MSSTLSFQRSKLISTASLDRPEQPRILFSHIPLARSETAPCGPLRSRGGIHRGAGPGYQNMLGKQTTEFLLQTVRPAIVFRYITYTYIFHFAYSGNSGDDRDYCEIRHSVSMDGSEVFVPEITIKSFSPVKGDASVGFHLLSLIPPPDDPDLRTLPTFIHSPCFLPALFNVYESTYLPASVLTLLILLVRRYRGPQYGHSRRSPSLDGLISPLNSAFPPGTSRATVPMSPFADFVRGHKFTHSRGHRLQISVDRTHEAVDVRNTSGWAWEFSFRGRRRRFVLRRPQLYVRFVDRLATRFARRLNALPWIHSPFATASFEFVHVIWPSVVLWIVLAWWTMP